MCYKITSWGIIKSDFCQFPPPLHSGRGDAVGHVRHQIGGEQLYQTNSPYKFKNRLMVRLHERICQQPGKKVEDQKQKNPASRCSPAMRYIHVGFPSRMLKFL